MSKSIFTWNKSTLEEQLYMNDDRSFTYTTEKDGWAMVRNGAMPTTESMTAEEAKIRWPQYAAAIDDALAELV